jgi:hypothetical protein
VLFVATAAVVPVLISPSSPKTVAGPPATPTTLAPTPSPTPSSTPTPTPTPTPTKTVSPFLVRPAVKPLPVGRPPNKIWREFMSVCSLTRVSSKPPFSGLAESGSSARYQFAGSLSPSLATPGKVPTAGSSCVNGGDRSTYWAPVVRQGGTILRPDAFELYYKAGVYDYTTVQPFPPGLRMIVGGPAAAGTAPDRGQVSWSCTDYDEPTIPKPGTCKDGDRLILRLTSPSCWDGRHLDVAGHRGHLAWPVGDVCPGGHPIPVPELVMYIAYPFEAGTPVRTDTSNSGSAFGWGFVAGWQKAPLAKLIKDCIHAGQLCDSTGNPR